MILTMYAMFSVILGACLGSFWNVLIARLPYDESLLVPSHCPRCHARVRPWDLVPVVSWVVLRGRCRDCNSPISPSYPWIELFGGLLGYLIYRRVFPDGIADLDLAHVVAFVHWFVFASLLVVMAFVDLRHQIIPDPTSSYAVPFGVLGAVLLSWLGLTDFPSPGWEQSVLGALLGGGFLGAVALAWRWFVGEEALGFGDAKAMAMIGAFLGAIPGVWVVLLAASVLSALVHLAVLFVVRRRAALPFGPYLAGAALVYALYGDVLVPLFLPSIAAIGGLELPMGRSVPSPMAPE
jgi:leader peptidase (prepilin peptidase)/N-methyltransferase